MRSDAGLEDIARLFRALAADRRLELMRLLSHRRLCVGALANVLGVSAGAVSQHLRVLKEAGLVEPDRRGYFIHYQLTPGAAERCRAAMDTLFGASKGGRRCAAQGRRARGRRN
jgi:DNA-binding transcriptional ArsR family regulator